MKPIERRIARLEAEISPEENVLNICRIIFEPDGNGGRREVGRIYRQPDGSLGPLISTANKGNDES
jgi:hypothetical protein